MLSKPQIDWIESYIGKSVTVTQVISSDKNSVFEIDASNDKYFLKIGPNIEIEKQKLEWLYGKLPVPKVKGFNTDSEAPMLLMTAITGKNLASLAPKWGPERVISKLVGALHKFHAVDIKDYPFGQHGPDLVLVHGDACLPNFIYHGEELNGYIDLGDMEAGVAKVDLAAGVWTLQYNFGPGYGLKFLQQYGAANPSEEMVYELHELYESYI